MGLLLTMFLPRKPVRISLFIYESSRLGLHEIDVSLDNDQLAEMLGIKRRLTTPYHPQVCFVNATFFHVNRMCNWLLRLFGY